MVIYYLVGLVALGFVYMANARAPLAVAYPTSTVTALGAPGLSRNLGRRLPVMILTLILVVFASIRYGIGSDYFLYTSLYDQIDPHSLADSLQNVPQEFGWVFLGYLLKSATGSPYLILCVASVLTVVPTLIAIRRKSQDVVLAFFLYYFLGYYALSFNAVRQSIAVAFLMLGESYRSESRIKWISFSAIAAVFHSSALVALLIQFGVSRWKPTWSSVGVLIAVSGAFSYAVLNSSVIGALASSLNPRYETYLEGQGAGLGTWLIFSIRLLIIGLCLRLPRSKQTNVYLAYVCVSAIVLLMGTTYVVVARFEPYFGIYAVLLLPNILAEQPALQTKLSKLAISLAGLIYFGFYVASFNQILPYQMIPELASIL